MRSTAPFLTQGMNNHEGQGKGGGGREGRPLDQIWSWTKMLGTMIDKSNMIHKGWRSELQRVQYKAGLYREGRRKGPVPPRGSGLHYRQGERQDWGGAEGPQVQHKQQKTAQQQLTVLDGLCKSIMKVRDFAKDIISTPPDHGVVLVQVVLQRVACQGNAPASPQAVDGSKPLSGWVLDLVSLVCHHNLCFLTHNLKGLLG